MGLEYILIISTVLGGITAFWFMIEKLTRAVRAQKVIFPDCTQNFYHHYATVIREAKSEIYITSDGFNMRNPISREHAEIMKEALRFAMSNGVKVNRLQITNTMHLNWIPQIKALKEEFPEHFRVWVNLPLASVPNVCAIDASEKKCVAERMDHRLGLFGQGSVAHTFSFTHGDKKLALQMKQIVTEAIEHPGAQELSDGEFDELYSRLFQMRTAVLVAWVKAQSETSSEDLSASGVFDELVISSFLKDKHKKA